jgi:hypothetical protein
MDDFWVCTSRIYFGFFTNLGKEHPTQKAWPLSLAFLGGFFNTVCV